MHPNFASKTSKLKKVLKNFDTMGEDVVIGDRNTIKKVTLGDEVFNIKKFKTPNFFQGLVYQFLRKGKAHRSYDYAVQLLNLQINTPQPVAYFERKNFGLKESFYISLHLKYDFDFRVLNHNPKWPNREEILKQFAAFTFFLHESEVNFLDHSPGNTLVVEVAPKTYEFYLIDLNRMEFKALSFHERMKNFRRLWLSKTMINIMAPVYADLSSKSSEETHRLMTFYSRKFQKKVNSKKLRKRKRK